MKIITVCGLGVGTSLILKMTVESALNNLERDADVEHKDMGTLKGTSFDLLVTTKGFQNEFSDIDNVIYIDNVVGVEEVTDKLKTYFEEKGI